MAELIIVRPNAQLYSQMLENPSDADFPSSTMSAQRFLELNSGNPVESLDLPEPVQACVSILRAQDIWHVLTEGDESFSCRDAAGKRWRRGSVGIRERDELKSLFFQYIAPETEETSFVVTHTRATEQVDMDALSEAVGAEARMVKSKVLSKRFDGAEFGTVNPVLLSRFPNVYQLWDTIVAMRATGTMVTNAGHHRYAIEFLPYELCRAFPNSASFDLTDVSQRHALTYNNE